MLYNHWRNRRREELRSVVEGPRGGVVTSGLGYDTTGFIELLLPMHVCFFRQIRVAGPSWSAPAPLRVGPL